MKEKMKADYLTLFMPVFYLLTALVVVFLVVKSGTYPSGSDTMYHVYRGDYLYQSIKGGDWYPLLNPMWYNGVELMRYWAPLPAYFMAGCIGLAGGDSMNGYLVFVGLVCFLGAFSWMLIGRKINRPWLGAFLGLLWFFMPNNLLALFVEGNLARSLSMIFLPVFFYGVIEYLNDKNWKRLPLVTIMFSLMALCHLGYAGMVALATLLYLLVYRITTGRKKVALNIVIAIILGFMILGVWVYASLNGGITSMDSSENMKNFFQSAWTSLNPLERIQSNNSNFYFGLAALGLAIFGGFTSKKRSMPGFFTGIIIFICTTSAMYPVLKILPGSQYLWMLRFISIALCMILYSFLIWDTLKKPLIILLCLFLVCDTIPSLSMIYGNGDAQLVNERLDEKQRTALITKAQMITKQRLAFMDESSMGATGAYLVSDWNQPVAGTFGAGWEAANTRTNIAQLNRALTRGNYLYLFDRCLELGNDSVIVQLSQIDPWVAPIEKLDQAADKVGYELVESNSGYRLYHLASDLELSGWGTVTHYDAIGIGTASASAALQFPAMEETTSTNLNDYTFEQLQKYKLVYLAGFTYDDREKAEDLVIRLSEAGVHVVIAADGMPQDKKTRNQSFLGVTCNAISFANGYPELDTEQGVLNTDLFPQGFTNWQTVYLEGLDETKGYLYDNGLKLDFYGTVKNENISMIGLNLGYFYNLTQDKSVESLYNNMLQLNSDELPKRTIVPLKIEYNKNQITVTSENDEVNTTIAYHDIFQSESKISDGNHLTYVDKGTTVIQLEYPHLWIGILISMLGIGLTVVFLLIQRKKYREENMSLQS